MSEVVRIRLFGAFAVRVGDEPVPESAWRLRKAKSLVKLLALAPERRMHRERVTEFLWPELAPGAAANNFHQALYVFNQTRLPNYILVAERLDMAHAVEVHGRVDILVNNMGGVRLRLNGFLGTSDEEFEWAMRMNFFSAVRATRAAVARMLEQGGGAIVSVASVNAFFQPDGGTIDWSVAPAEDPEAFLHDNPLDNPFGAQTRMRLHR